MSLYIKNYEEKKYLIVTILFNSSLTAAYLIDIIKHYESYIKDMEILINTYMITGLLVIPLLLRYFYEKDLWNGGFCKKCRLKWRKYAFTQIYHCECDNNKFFLFRKFL